MSARPRRTPLLALLLALGLIAAGSAPAGAASTYSRDVFFAAGYERQVDSRTCTAAATAMMMNFIARRDLGLSQMAILRYEQPRDALPNSTQRGSDPLGWSRAATYYSNYTIRPTTYRWEAYSTESAALRRAAYQLARYRKAVGLLVQHGQHAVVMTGFTSTRSPLRGSWKLTGVYYSDPLGSSHTYVGAAYSPLNTYLELDATPYYDSLWYGKYVVVVPIN
jgi:hypothetical protein